MSAIGLAGCPGNGTAFLPPACPAAGPEVAADYRRLSDAGLGHLKDFMGHVMVHCEEIDAYRKAAE